MRGPHPFGHAMPVRWPRRLLLGLIALFWALPVMGLFLTSLRDADRIAASGWWALFLSDQEIIQLPMAGLIAAPEGGLELSGPVTGFGLAARQPLFFAVGESAPLQAGGTIRVERDGRYWLALPANGAPTESRLYLGISRSEAFSTRHYQRALTTTGLLHSLGLSLAVALPSTLIPLILGLLAAYGLVVLRRGSGDILALLIILMAVPVEAALMPLMGLFTDLAEASGAGRRPIWGLWLAHSGFVLPLAIVIFANALKALPSELVEAARLDGLGDLAILRQILLPLIWPVLAAFALLQFLWVWNDLLVALVFLGAAEERLLVTTRLLGLMGTYGGDWGLMAAAAFVGMAVPALLFAAFGKWALSAVLISAEAMRGRG
ncbi:MAG: carbohydrate ABC transporter permease [Paracoccaceae bacterium]